MHRHTFIYRTRLFHHGERITPILIYLYRFSFSYFDLSKLISIKILAIVNEINNNSYRALPRSFFNLIYPTFK